MLNIDEIYGRAFGEVAQLTELIEVVADYSTSIEVLQSLIIDPENTSPEGRANANNARERLHALRAAAELLVAVLQRA